MSGAAHQPIFPAPTTLASQARATAAAGAAGRFGGGGAWRGAMGGTDAALGAPGHGRRGPGPSDPIARAGEREAGGAGPSKAGLKRRRSSVAHSERSKRGKAGEAPGISDEAGGEPPPPLRCRSLGPSEHSRIARPGEEVAGRGGELGWSLRRRRRSSWPSAPGHCAAESEAHELPRIRGGGGGAPASPPTPPPRKQKALLAWGAALALLLLSASVALGAWRGLGWLAAPAHHIVVLGSHKDEVQWLGEKARSAPLAAPPPDVTPLVTPSEPTRALSAAHAGALQRAEGAKRKSFVIVEMLSATRFSRDPFHRYTPYLDRIRAWGGGVYVALLGGRCATLVDLLLSRRGEARPREELLADCSRDRQASFDKVVELKIREYFPRPDTVFALLDDGNDAAVHAFLSRVLA